MRPRRRARVRASAGWARLRGGATALLAVAVLTGSGGCVGQTDHPGSTPPGTAAGSPGVAAAGTRAPAWVRGTLRDSAVWQIAGVQVQVAGVGDAPGPGADAGHGDDATQGDDATHGDDSRRGDEAGQGDDPRHGDEAGRDAREVAVVGALPRSELAAVRDIAAEAVRTVDGTWARAWPGRLLVVVPADRSQWEAIARPGGSGGTASGVGTGAKTVPQAGSKTRAETGAGAGTGTGSPTGEGADAEGPPVAPAMTVDGADGAAHVVLDPVAWRAATPMGRRALVIHEAVHVAVRADRGPGGAAAAPSASAPLWLSEGYAQFVAYGAVGVEPRRIAGDLLERLRREGPPAALPDEARLTGSPRQRLDAYALAWLACDTLAARAGPDAPRRAMEAGTVAAAGLDERALTRAWQEDLRRLASAGGRRGS